MIRLIIEIEKRDNTIWTNVMTDGVQYGRHSEMKHAKKLIESLGPLLGENLETVEYLKDLPPPDGGNKQQQT